MAYVSQPAIGRVTPDLREASLIEWVTPDLTAAQPFVAALNASGFRVSAVTSPSGTASALILAHGLASPRETLHTDAVAALKINAPRLEAKGGTVILLQDTGGLFQPHDHRAWRGGLSGLARTAAREFAAATIRLIDIDVAGFGTALAASNLAEELLTGGTAPTAGLSPAGRYVPQDTGLTLPRNQPGRLGAQDVILVTGGARGVTADCVIELARRTGACFALLGRSQITPWPAGLPEVKDEKALRGALAKAAKDAGEKITPAALNSRVRALLSGAEIRDTLDAIAHAGGGAHYIPADVSDPAALGAALANIRSQLGEITGLVHGAGVLADKLIREKTPEQIARVFGPKIGGLEALISQLDTSQLKTVVFFSSVAARYGNAGQADYAMANEILNRMAWWLKSANPTAAITSINWGPWDGGMVDDGLRAKFAELGVPLISKAAGANAFADAVLAGAACPVELVAGAEIAHV